LAVSSGETGVASRYALALFELADEAKQLDEVADDLRTVDAAIAESGDLQRLVRSPVISRNAAAAAMTAILEKTEARELTRNFIGLVAANRRLFALRAMIRAYLAELAGRRGEVTAEVTSAIPLDDAQTEAIADALRKAVGSKVAVNVHVDPGLIGGLVVRVGSRMVDFSMRTKLEKMKLAMKGAA
jgi:F-type H+-transporting ATPase subunit delta